MSTALEKLGAKVFTSPTHDPFAIFLFMKGTRSLMLNDVLAKSMNVKPSLGTSKLIFAEEEIELFGEYLT